MTTDPARSGPVEIAIHASGLKESGLPPNRLRNLAAVCLIVSAIGFIGFFFQVAYQLADSGMPGESVSNDFSVFWGAARIALERSPIDAFDLGKLEQARNLPASVEEGGRRMAWNYPPQFHALILPLGFMSFGLAWLVFDLVGIAALWIGLKRLIPGNIIRIIACASPAVLMCAFQGQSSLMVAGVLAGFLASLHRGQHILAGVLLACLTIKPQFGPLLPLALITCGNWRVIGWAVAASLMILMATLAWVGPDYWVAFTEGLSNATTWVKIGWLPRHLMITWYAFGIGAGLPANWANGLQLGFTVLMALVVIWTWRQPLAPFALKAAVLTLAIPLASPYAYYYDLALPMIGVALMLTVLRPKDYSGVAAVIAVWALPTLGHFGKELGVDYAFALFSAPILTVSLALLLRRVATTSDQVAP